MSTMRVSSTTAAPKLGMHPLLILLSTENNWMRGRPYLRKCYGESLKGLQPQNMPGRDTRISHKDDAHATSVAEAPQRRTPQGMAGEIGPSSTPDNTPCFALHPTLVGTTLSAN
jgi:hypothetical protein